MTDMYLLMAIERGTVIPNEDGHPRKADQKLMEISSRISAILDRLTILRKEAGDE